MIAKQQPHRKLPGQRKMGRSFHLKKFRRLISLIILTVAWTPTRPRASCRLAFDPTLVPYDSPQPTMKYCEPSKGCTFVNGYADCVRDNETPNCVYLDTSSLTCKLCYASETSSGGVQWTPSPPFPFASPRACENA